MEIEPEEIPGWESRYNDLYEAHHARILGTKVSVQRWTNAWGATTD